MTFLSPHASYIEIVAESRCCRSEEASEASGERDRREAGGVQQARHKHRRPACQCGGGSSPGRGTGIREYGDGDRDAPLQGRSHVFPLPCVHKRIY